MTDDDMTTPASFTLTRTLEAPRALVWRAWTDPALTARWWHPAGVEVETKFQIGSREAYIPALQDGSIDLIPDYTGNLLRFLDAEATASSAEDVDAALPAAEDAPDLADEDGGWSLGGTAVPHGLLFRTRAGWGCARVARSRLRFGNHPSKHPRQNLTLEPVWGAPPEGLPERSYALSAHGFTALTR